MQSNLSNGNIGRIKSGLDSVDKRRGMVYSCTARTGHVDLDWRRDGGLEEALQHLVNTRVCGNNVGLVGHTVLHCCQPEQQILLLDGVLLSVS